MARNNHQSTHHKYKVLISFTDSDDKKAVAGENVYWVGDVYPRTGYEPTTERIAYLQSTKNQLKKPVIDSKTK